MSSPRHGEHEPVVIRDNRKIDPVTGEARKVGAHTAPETSGDAAGAIGHREDAALLLEERTRDLQRVQAEYANYRKRADRDRLAAGDLAVGRALAELLPVLDDLDRARAHGDLIGGLKAVADKLEDALTKLGLEEFGEVGDPFDPAIHEAVMHEESAQVTTPTCTTVLRHGYRHKDRLLRAAMVGVTDPSSYSPDPEPAEPQSEEGLEGNQAGTNATKNEDPADGPPLEGNPATHPE